MSMFVSVRKWLAAAGLLCVTPSLVSAQTYSPLGGEYRIAGQLLGDQTASHLSASTKGALLVWQDNFTDGRGLGIGALRLDGNFFASLSPFRVNEITADDQENPQVAHFSSGGAVVVWQGGRRGLQNIYVRFIAANGTFATGDIKVNSHSGTQKSHPAVTIQSDDSVVVVWSSGGQDGSMQGVFGQRLSAVGEKLGTEFKINETTRYNQRNPVVTALNGERFVVAWISEQQRFEASVDLFGRLYDGSAAPVGSEFRLNASTNLCATPSIAKSSSGGFRVAWSRRDVANIQHAWDVVTRGFDASGAPVDDEQFVNTHRPSIQVRPRLAWSGVDYLVIWTSVGQDGSRDGVYGQFLSGNGARTGDEFRVNSNVIGRQIEPAVAADGDGKIAVVWSSYAGGAISFDLFSQRYGSSGQPTKPAPPLVSALSQSRLGVAWPVPEALSISGYELYIDDNTTPLEVANSYYSAGPFAPGSTHSFRIAYKLSNGNRSAISDATSKAAWGSDENFDGIPDDWQRSFWGDDTGSWPAGGEDSDSDGASNLKEFLTGTNPTDRASVLRVRISRGGRGAVRVEWNAQPGLIYQVQASSDLKNWTDASQPRFAAGTSDAVLITGSTFATYYRVIRVR